MDYPKWMKPHLRARLEAEREAKERTGPKPGEPALVADGKGNVKTITTDHGKPATPKIVRDSDDRVVGYTTPNGVTVTVKRDSRGRCVALVPAFNFENAIPVRAGESLIDSVNKARDEHAQKLNLYGNRWREQQERHE